MTVDAKVVDKALRMDVFGFLKEIGFTRRKGLKLWRDHEFFVDIIQFRHFSPYLADGLKTETFSVTIDLGVFFTNTSRKTKRNGDTPLPDAVDGHFRGNILKHLRQPELERRDIWHINPDGSNLDAVITDIENVVQKDVPAWFKRVHDLDVMREILETEGAEIVDDDIPILFGFGNPGSPNRLGTIAAVDDVLAKVKRAAGT